MVSDEFIFGRNAVMEVLEQKPEHVIKLYLHDQLRGGIADRLVRMAAASRIPVQRIPPKKMAEMVGKVNDQGVAASVTEASYVELEDWLETIHIEDHPVLFALDEIEDPHNFGAILRSAVAAGVDGVMVSRYRQAPLSSGVMKASSGMALRMPVIRTGNLNQALMKLKASGFWVCGTEMKAERSYWEQRYDMPLVVVIGSEEKGIRKKTAEHCDMMVHIPMEKGVESLNASVSSALIAYEILRQKLLKQQKKK